MTRGLWKANKQSFHVAPLHFTHNVNVQFARQCGHWIQRRTCVVLLHRLLLFGTSLAFIEYPPCSLMGRCSVVYDVLVFMFHLLLREPREAASDACLFFFCFFYVRSALISGDSAGCVISVSSTCAVNNLHSRLLVARQSPSPGGCRIKEGARTVGSISAGFSLSWFFIGLIAWAPFSFIHSWASPVWWPWEPSTWLPTLKSSPTRDVGRHLFQIPKDFDCDHKPCDLSRVSAITLSVPVLHWVPTIKPWMFPKIAAVGRRSVTLWTSQHFITVCGHTVSRQLQTHRRDLAYCLMSLNGGRKPQYLERSRAGTGNTC